MATDVTFATNIDLASNELRNARAHILSAAPAVAAGKFYYNSADNKLYWYNGTSWISAGGAELADLSGQASAFNQLAANGTASTAARSDHYHALPAHNALAHSSIKLSDLAAPSVNLAMGGYKLTGLAAGSANGDSLRYEQVIGQFLPLNGGTLTGDLIVGNGADAYIGAPGGARAKLDQVTNYPFRVTPTDNSGTAVENVFQFNNQSFRYEFVSNLLVANPNPLADSTLTVVADDSGYNGRLVLQGNNGVVEIQGSMGTPYWRVGGNSGTFYISKWDGASPTTVIAISQADLGITVYKDVAMSSKKITGLAAGTAASDAVTKSQLDGKANTSHSHAIGDTTGLQAALDLKAPLASPELTGTPKAPTAAAGTNNTQIATTAYVDAATQAATAGLNIKNSVRVATMALAIGTYNGTGGASGRGQYTGAPNYIDGVTLAANDRILVYGPGSPGAGIWKVTTVGTGTNGVWDRATDWDGDADAVANSFVFVQEGVNYKDTGWVLSTNTPVTVGGASGTSVTFTQFSAAGTPTWGDGLSIDGAMQVNVGAGTGISVGPDTVSIDTAVVARKYSTTLGAAATSHVITHNLNTQDVNVTVRKLSDQSVCITAWEDTSVNTVTVYFATATGNTHRVTVMG